MELAIMAICTERVAKARQVRTVGKPCTGSCFCWAVVPKTLVTRSKNGVIEVRRRARCEAMSGRLRKR
jgi:hypothetical protein